jgi:hypothetical protein
MLLLVATLVAGSLLAQATPSPSASPATTPTPASSGQQSLRLDIPPGWQRTESGRYNEWRSPDGTSNFRVTPTGVTDDLHGPNAADVVKAEFQKMLAVMRPGGAQVTVQTVSVCNGTQPAYRVNDPIGVGSAGFMMLIPGTRSSGLINYEIHPGGKADPAILSTIDKICWP